MSGDASRDSTRCGNITATARFRAMASSCRDFLGCRPSDPNRVELGWERTSAGGGEADFFGVEAGGPPGVAGPPVLRTGRAVGPGEWDERLRRGLRRGFSADGVNGEPRRVSGLGGGRAGGAPSALSGGGVKRARTRRRIEPAVRALRILARSGFPPRSPRRHLRPAHPPCTVARSGRAAHASFAGVSRRRVGVRRARTNLPVCQGRRATGIMGCKRVVRPEPARVSRPFHMRHGWRRFRPR